MSPLRHVLLTDHIGSAQRGDAAIIEGSITSLSTALPEAAFTVMTDRPEATRVISGVEAVRQPSVFRDFRPSWLPKALYLLLWAAAYRRGWRLPTFGNRHALAPFLKADLIVSKGGSFISTFYWPGCLGRVLCLLFCKLLGKRVVVLGQSVGPLDSWLLRRIAKAVYSRTDLNVLRDEESYRILVALGVPEAKLRVTADLAFCLPPHGSPLSSRAEDLPQLPRDGRPKVSLSVRRWHGYAPGRGHAEYVSAMAALCDHLTAVRNARVYFLSTCTGFDGYRNDDRTVAYEVLQQMRSRYEDNPLVFLGEYSAAELAALYSQMDLHVGTRMHSNILALLGGTPTVIVRYEFKSDHVASLFGLERYVLDTNTVTGPELIEKVNSALDQRDALREQVARRLPLVRERAYLGAQLVAELVTKEEQGLGDACLSSAGLHPKASRPGGLR